MPDHTSHNTLAQRIDADHKAVACVAPADTLTPADRYQELFVDVQLGGVFADSKCFVDCMPKRDPSSILEAYQLQKEQPNFRLADFVHAHFTPEHRPRSSYVSDPGQSLTQHIDGLWSVLTRSPSEHPKYSSLLPLPEKYVVPGGRFGELYYWDSYFTMLGLAESGRIDLMRAMADNFAYLIDTYGHVPNGNRTYYLSRSQPPAFSLMVELFEIEGLSAALDYLPQLRKEHAWWTQNDNELRPGEAHRSCVRLSNGALLNRYWDDRDTPREESYAEDVATAARQSTRPTSEVYRDLRAAAASGWDFSSRWCDSDLPSIATTSIIPVDLNSFLHHLETQISRLSERAGEPAAAVEFKRRADARAQAIETLLWNEKLGAYVDFDLRTDQPRDQLTAAAAAPLLVRLASPEHAARVGKTLEQRLLLPGGLATSESRSGQQWDQPNGWAPLQWMACRGLFYYGQQLLAQTIADRWLSTVGGLYERQSKLVEKYVLTDTECAHGGGGGEYPLQDGFGWTNGVTRRLLHVNPAHRANRACANPSPA